MKAIITGASGAIGQYLVSYLRLRGWKTLSWNRDMVGITDHHQMALFISRIKPDLVFHLASYDGSENGIKNESWQVNYNWPTQLAEICQQNAVRLFYLSSSEVFKHTHQGPFAKTQQTVEVKGLGYEKRMAEQQIMTASPLASIIRLGWQLSLTHNLNKLAHSLLNPQPGHKHVELSSQYYPACSFIEDSCAAIETLVSYPPGLYQLDSNRKWSLYDIGQALTKEFKVSYKIDKVSRPIKDRRMLETCFTMPSLHHRLHFLK